MDDGRFDFWNTGRNIGVSILGTLPQHRLTLFESLAVSRFLTHRTRDWCPMSKLLKVCHLPNDFELNFLCVMRVAACVARALLPNVPPALPPAVPKVPYPAKK
jgi:hypothetical protein